LRERGLQAEAARYSSDTTVRPASRHGGSTRPGCAGAAAFATLHFLSDQDLAANEREVRHPRQLTGHDGFARGTTLVMRYNGGSDRRVCTQRQNAVSSAPEVLR